MNRNGSFKNFLELLEFEANREDLTAPSAASQDTLFDNYIENWFASETNADIAHDEPRVRVQTNRQGVPAKTNASPVPRSPPINQLTTKTLADDKLASFWRKQDFLIQMIACLESSNSLDAIEADIGYSHLASLYKSFMSNVEEITLLATNIDLDRQIKITKETQRRVIALQVSLKKIISKESPSKDSKVNDQTDGIEISNSSGASNSQTLKVDLSIEQAKMMESGMLAGTGQTNCSKSEANPTVTKGISMKEWIREFADALYVVTVTIAYLRSMGML